VEAFYFSNNGARLFGVLHRPAETPRLGLAFCCPYGQEMVSSYARFSRWAKLLEQEGIAVLRFHYGGTGESAGSSGDFSFESACADTEAAVICLRERLAGTPLGLFGYRFGATVAARVASRVRPDMLVLWAPVVDPAAYLRELLRLRLTKELVHQRQGHVKVTRRELVEQLEAGQCIDLFGDDLSPVFYSQLLEANPWAEPPVGVKVLWLARAQEGRPGADKARHWQQVQVAIDYRAIPEIVFWEEDPPGLPERFTQETAAWLQKVQAQG